MSEWTRFAITVSRVVHLRGRGAQLPGMTVGVRTELVIAGAPDKGDLDPVLVHPLPSQDAVLNAFGQLGFSFRSADVEAGPSSRTGSSRWS